MNGFRNSDESIVPAKRANNNAVIVFAEFVEGRVSTKRNNMQFILLS